MNIVRQGTTYFCELSRLHVFEMWCEETGTNTERVKNVLDAIKKYIEQEGYEPELDELENCVNYICKRIAALWKKNQRSKSVMLKQHFDWLDNKATISLKCGIKPTVSSDSNRGSPKKDIAQSSTKTLRRRVAEPARHDESVDILSSETNVEEVSSLLTETNVEEVSSLLTEANVEEVSSLLMETNVEEVSSLLMETNLTKYQYSLIRSFINSKVSYNLLPSYEKVLNSRNKSSADEGEKDY